MRTRQPICFFCRHFIQNDKYVCKGFPEGIPMDILLSKTDHNNPKPGQQNDIVYDRMSREEINAMLDKKFPDDSLQKKIRTNFENYTR